MKDSLGRRTMLCMGMAREIVRLLWRAAMTVAFLAGVIEAGQEAASPVAAPLKDIKIIFKLDQRLTRGQYMGDLWVPRVTYVVAQGEPVTIDARAFCIDAGGKPVVLSPEWTPQEPEMVAVAPSRGNSVRITVRRAGESGLEVTSRGVTRTLFIKAKELHEGKALQVDISQ